MSYSRINNHALQQWKRQGKLKKYIAEDETYCVSIREPDPVDVFLSIDEFEAVSYDFF